MERELCLPVNVVVESDHAMCAVLESRLTSGSKSEGTSEGAGDGGGR